MPKVTPGPLISSIHGSMHGTTFRRISRGFFSSPRRKPKDTRTPRQTTVRRALSYVATRWYQLSGAQHTAWDDYGGNYSPRLTGFNTFMKLNTRLLAASYTTLVLCTSPPTEPETPLHLDHLRSFEISETQNAIGWRGPSDPTLYVSLYESVEPGFSYRGKRRWTLVETQPTYHGQIVHTHGQPSEIPISYRIHIIGEDGRQPPPTEVSKPYDTPSVYVCDEYPDRTKEYGVPTLELRDSFNAWPDGGDPYALPVGIAVDQYYAYVSFFVYRQLAIFSRFNWKHVKTVITATQPLYIALDDTYLYVNFPFTGVVEKRLKSDLSYVAEYDPGDPLGVSAPHVDDTYLWLTIVPGGAIHRVTKSDMLFSASYGTAGSGDNQFQNPAGICGDDTYFYVADRGNDRIKKHRKSDWAFIAANGTTGTGDDQFDQPYGIAITGGYLIIADFGNNRLKVHLATTLSFLSKTGAEGYNIQQFTRPVGVNTLP